MRGLFACALIKNCWFWLMDVPGDEIDFHLQDIEMGDTEAIQGKTKMDKATYNLLMMKEPDYFMKMINNGGNLNVDHICHMTIRHWTSNRGRVGA